MRADSLWYVRCWPGRDVLSRLKSTHCCLWCCRETDAQGFAKRLQTSTCVSCAVAAFDSALACRYPLQSDNFSNLLLPTGNARTGGSQVAFNVLEPPTNGVDNAFGI